MVLGLGRYLSDLDNMCESSLLVGDNSNGDRHRREFLLNSFARLAHDETVLEILGIIELGHRLIESVDDGLADLLKLIGRTDNDKIVLAINLRQIPYTTSVT